MAPKRKTSVKAPRKSQKKQKTLKDPRPSFFKRNDLEWSADASEGVWNMAMSIQGVPVIENDGFLPGVVGNVKSDRFYYDTQGNVCGVFYIKTNGIAIQVGLAPEPAETIKERWTHCTVQYLDCTTKGYSYVVSAPLVPEWGDIKTIQPYDYHIVWEKKDSKYKTILSGSGSKKAFCKIPDEGLTVEYLQTVAQQRLQMVGVILAPHDNHLVEEVGLIHVGTFGTISSHQKVYMLPPAQE
ncbi:MAG: hypothetical protein CMP20_01850 [Rickettsiales bacterium]|nr:hypothetical protein [Rickettsiales bacterium]